MQSTSKRWLLRQRTAECHAALDAAVGPFDDLAGYRRYLSALATFRAPLERQLGGIAWPDALGTWRPSAIAPLLAEDMADLGVALRVAGADALHLAGARLYGALYVLEGSCLGARVLLARAQELGLSATHGARHLARLAGSIDGWRTFLTALEAVDPFDLESAVEGSVHAFGAAKAAFGAR
jgi:heme oxygenase